MVDSIFTVDMFIVLFAYIQFDSINWVNKFSIHVYLHVHQFNNIWLQVSYFCFSTEPRCIDIYLGLPRPSCGYYT